MLKDAIQYLVSLKDNKTYTINGDTYSDRELHRIPRHVPHPSRISKDNGVTTRDNGVSQEVEARTGVSLKQLVQVKPRVKLRPYRTFLEVEQPESEFILRLDNDGNVGLFEADGGMWKMQAKASIVAYFEEKLAEEITGGKVVVMM